MVQRSAGGALMKELTVFEEIILTAILRLKDDAYGVSIRKKADQVAGKDFIYGTLYNTLDQLVRKGHIAKRQGSPTPERGGRGKIFYTLTPEGLQALADARALHARIWNGIGDFSKNKS
jgi:PadR family transcriptional regulator, regulatory protein PadR